MIFAHKIRALMFCAMVISRAAETFGQGLPLRDLSCLLQLNVPLYQQLARDARASGSVRAVVEIGKSGNPGSIEVEGTAAPGIKALVRSAFREARFDVSCASRFVEVNFVYRLEGQPSPEPRNKLRFIGPNTFEITSTPAIPIPTVETFIETKKAGDGREVPLQQGPKRTDGN